jgi:arabinogalactan oligomer/maltooligosaccharide transport system permease protein
MARSPSHRRRVLAGLAAALAVGAGGAWLLLRGARGEVAEAVRQRQAVVSLLALDGLVARAGEGEPVRRLLAAWQAQQPPGGEARVLRLQGVLLEASTSPRDAGERAAPRRLAREEKPLFDQGQRLRAAAGGDAEGGASKPEIEVEPAPGGALSLAAPLRRDGQVVGLVRITTAPPPVAAPQGVLGLLLAVVLPLAAFALAARALGERRGRLLAAALAALLAGLLLFGADAVRSLEEAHRAGHAAVAAHARAQAAQALGLAAAEGLPAEPRLDPAALDADGYGRPRGFLTREGALDPVRVEEDSAGARGDAQGALLATGILAVAVLSLVGLGGVARAGRALVRHRQAYLYVAPAMLGTLVLVFFPFLYGIALSFTDSNLYNVSAPLRELWVGFRNYAAILGDFSVARRGADGALVWNYLDFYWTLGFTVVWTVANVAFGVSFGLLLALVLDVKGLALRPVYRVLLILPWAMPNYITALIWKGMFHRQFGVVNQALALAGVEPVSWFDAPFTSFLTALATNAWLSFPFMMVVSLGALQSIPADLYEAARVDGASRWQQFRAITLPSLRPALVPAVILSVVWTFNMFNIIYLVTGGEPGGATEILVTQSYKFAFERYRYGYAAAYATVIFGILLVYGTFQNRVTRATEAL